MLIFLQNQPFRNTVKVSNSINLDQSKLFVESDQGSNCLQRLSAAETSRQIINKYWPALYFYIIIQNIPCLWHFLRIHFFTLYALMDSSFWFDKNELGMVNSTSKSHISKNKSLSFSEHCFCFSKRSRPWLNVMLCGLTVCQSTP